MRDGMSENENIFVGFSRRAGMLAVSLLCAMPAAAAVYELIPIDGSSTATSISNNGWVAGNASGGRAFIWSLASGLQFLGDLPGGTVASTARGVNDAGQVVGQSNAAGGNRAFLWTAAAGMQDLGTLPGDNSSYAAGVNELGHVVGTSSGSSGYAAFLWTPENGMQNLGNVPGGAGDVYGRAINDRDQIVGHTAANGVINAYIWDPATGMTSLGDLPTGSSVSYAFGISNTPQVVGRGNTLDGDRAFVWSEATGMQNLGTMPNGYGSYAYGTNNNGEVVGHFTLGGQHRAFLWTAAAGMLDLNLLADAEASGWLLMEAYDINDNGWIVGLGVNPVGAYQAFLLRPSSIMLGDLAPKNAPDGRLNVADMVRLMRFAVRLETPTAQEIAVADIDGDGVVSLRDVLRLRYLLDQ